MKKVIFALFLVVSVFLYKDAVLEEKEVVHTEISPEGEMLYLPDIVVTAAKGERAVFHTPQSVSVISEDEILRGSASTTPDLLLTQPGILIQKTSHGGGSPFIRGLTGKHILLLIDGVRLNNSLYRFGPHQYLNTIDPNQIERIEVVRGPSSVLYGSDALGGVINVITKKRENFLEDYGLDGLIQIQYGHADRHYSGGARMSGNIRSLGYVSGLSYKEFDHLRGGGDKGRQVPSGYEEVDADLKLNYRINKNQDLILAEQYVRQFDVPKTSEVILGDKIKFNYEPQIRSLTYVEYSGRDLINHYIDVLRLNLSYSIQEEGEEVIKDDPEVETRELNKAKTLGGFLHVSSRIGGHNLLGCGLEYYTDSIESKKDEINLPSGLSTQVKSAFPDGSDYNTLGIYIQDELNLLERLSFVVGGRYSRISADGALTDQNTGEPRSSPDTDNLSGSFSTIIGLTQNINLIGGVAQGFRAPNMEDFFGKVDFDKELSNTDLKPEKSINYELGLKANFPRLKGEVFYFLSDYKDLISRVEEYEGVFQRRNVGKSRIYGVEISSTYYLTYGWSVFGNCSYIYGEDRDTGEPLSRIPPMMGSFGVRYIREEKYWFEYYSLFADRQDRLSSRDKDDDPRIPKGGTPGYLTFNLKGGAALFGGSEVMLTFENITDKEYKTHGSGIYRPGRNFVVSYKLPF